jgi:hypothetical protein
MALILVIGFGVTLGVATRAITGRLSEAVDNSSAYYNKTRAKNIASSAAEIYVRKLKAGSVSTGSFSLNTIMGGNVSGSITSTDVDAASDPDTIRMIIVGHYDTMNDTIVNILTTNQSIAAPSITGALGVSNGNAATLNLSGEATFDGRNHNMSGALDATEPSVHGFTFGSPTYTTTRTPPSYTIIGTGATPDTEKIATQPNYTALALQLEGLADQTITAGNNSPATYGADTLHPQITVFKPVSSKLTNLGTITGSGIFIVDVRKQDVEIKGLFTFTGLVIVVGDSAGTHTATWTNANPITGAMLLVGSKTKLTVSNKMDIYYSADAIGMAFSMSKLLGNYIICDWWE